MSRSQVLQIPFTETETYVELCKSCRAARAAQQDYLLYADACEAAGLPVIAHAFRFTAAQEKEHAEIFEGLLTVQGGVIPAIDGAERALPPSPQAMLEAAARQESAAGQKDFLSAAYTAQEEGFPRIAMTFLRVAETERAHARRFAQYLQALQDGSLFRDEMRVGWLCLPCGQLSYGTDAPDVCAACGVAHGFIRSSFHPFAVYENDAAENCIPASTVL